MPTRSRGTYNVLREGGEVLQTCRSEEEPDRLSDETDEYSAGCMYHRVLKLAQMIAGLVGCEQNKRGVFVDPYWQEEHFLFRPT